MAGRPPFILQLRELLHFSKYRPEDYWFISVAHDLFKRYFRLASGDQGMIPHPQLTDWDVLDFLAFFHLADMLLAEDLDSQNSA
jgi:hypothetical protein